MLAVTVVRLWTSTARQVRTLVNKNSIVTFVWSVTIDRF
jgi:hypothetical protein